MHGTRRGWLTHAPVFASRTCIVFCLSLLDSVSNQNLEAFKLQLNCWSALLVIETHYLSDPYSMQLQWQWLSEVLYFHLNWCFSEYWWCIPRWYLLMLFSIDFVRQIIHRSISFIPAKQHFNAAYTCRSGVLIWCDELAINEALNLADLAFYWYGCVHLS